jgi:hypothetical protein
MVFSRTPPALPLDDFAAAVARVAAAQLRQAPRPLFANPACYFVADAFGVHASPKIRYLSRRDVVTHTPAQILRHLEGMPASAHGCRIVLAIATQLDGDVHSSSDPRPDCIQLYLADVGQHAVYEARCVAISADWHTHLLPVHEARLLDQLALAVG